VAYAKNGGQLVIALKIKKIGFALGVVVNKRCDCLLMVF
jgi:hypothetical protein